MRFLKPCLLIKRSLCTAGDASSRIMSSRADCSKDPLVSAGWLKDARESGITRVLDAAYTPGPRADHYEFKAKHFGKFKELSNNMNAEYTSSHIPGAVHFDLDVGQFPGDMERYALYPPYLFEEYVRLLGVNEDDHVTVVGRGPAAGMLFAARPKVYGHEKVSVLDGGLDAWTAAGYPVDDKHVSVKMGNWKANDIDKTRVITYEEIDFTKLDQLNYLDGRPKAQFEGAEPLAVPSSKPLTGAHAKGAKNVPAGGLVEEGRLANGDKINQALSAINFNPSKPTITACNSGMQASLLAMALFRVGHKNVRLYNVRRYVKHLSHFQGSLFELAQRAPDLVSEK